MDGGVPSHHPNRLSNGKFWGLQNLPFDKTENQKFMWRLLKASFLLIKPLVPLHKKH
jgi:hypothetical protein